MKNLNNTSSALKIIRPATSDTSKVVAKNSKKVIKVPRKKFVAAKKTAAQIARANLRKKVSVIKTAAYLLQMVGMVCEVALLAAGNLLNGFLVSQMGVSPAGAAFASIAVAASGLLLGLICVVFSVCLCGAAETMNADIKHLPLGQ